MFNKKDNSENISPVLIGNFSFLVPLREYIVDYDVTTKNSISAFLETSLALILKLETISPYELQTFFGLTEDEREALIKEIEASDFAVFTSTGALIATEKLKAAKEEDGKFYIEKLEQRTSKFYIDLYTSNIQTNHYKAYRYNFFQLAGGDEKFNPEEVFRDGFSRFIDFSKGENFEKYNTKLYRINDCFYTNGANLPISLNFYMETSTEETARISYEIVDDEEEKKTLIQNSGIMKHLNAFLSRTESSPALSISSFCKIINDENLLPFINKKENRINLTRLSSNFKLSSSARNFLLGEISLPNNREVLLDWSRSKTKLEPIFWKPSSSTFWGTSIYARIFYTELSELLKVKNSSLNLFFPSSKDNYLIQKRFHGLCDNLYFCPNADELDEIEIIVGPGNNCWALIQYYVSIESNNDYSAIKIPIGYTTTDPLEVEEIFNIFKTKINYTLDSPIVDAKKSGIKKKVLDWLS